jgi:hypothetical protein
MLDALPGLLAQLDLARAAAPLEAALGQAVVDAVQDDGRARA